MPLSSFKSRPRVRVDRLFRAFADPIRLRILSLLTDGEICVCDIVRVIRAPQPTISRHLAYLRGAGLVQARKQGLWMHYSLTPATDGSVHRKLIDCLQTCCADLPELQKDRQRLASTPRANSCCQ